MQNVKREVTFLYVKSSSERLEIIKKAKIFLILNFFGILFVNLSSIFVIPQRLNLVGCFEKTSTVPYKSASNYSNGIKY